ncbi:hypothetical protein K469DRAFT_693019 [Zopfia rhizophila CBS 207.26]|uniref:Uncharacterized protein n=1 Tax=Zopfia rhizophila CBS 207.26 TaxID=1314779 RepID=A0A6A6EPK8_9PEZI|nr:hypothetical protein K469DRAFT_693019 [Zopfia rhizophila CBS 207.26]
MTREAPLEVNALIAKVEGILSRLKKIKDEIQQPRLRPAAYRKTTRSHASFNLETISQILQEAHAVQASQNPASTVLKNPEIFYSEEGRIGHEDAQGENTQNGDSTQDDENARNKDTQNHENTQNDGNTQNDENTLNRGADAAVPDNGQGTTNSTDLRNNENSQHNANLRNDDHLQNNENTQDNDYEHTRGNGNI